MKARRAESKERRGQGEKMARREEG
jgi:hypothetical protein